MNIGWFILAAILIICIGEQVIEHMERKWERNRRKKAAQWLRNPSMRSFK